MPSAHVCTWTGAFLLALFHFFHQFDDLFVVRTNFFYGYIMIDDVNDAGKILAHICLDIVFSLEKFRIAIV